MFHIFGALAEFERGVIRERTHAGLAAARARGRNGGRKPKLATSDLATIRLLLEQTDRPFEDIARQFKVSVATLSRQFPGGRAYYRRSA